MGGTTGGATGAGQIGGHRHSTAGRVHIVHIVINIAFPPVKTTIKISIVTIIDTTVINVSRALAHQANKRHIQYQHEHMGIAGAGVGLCGRQRQWRRRKWRRNTTKRWNGPGRAPGDATHNRQRAGYHTWQQLDGAACSSGSSHGSSVHSYTSR